MASGTADNGFRPRYTGVMTNAAPQTLKGRCLCGQCGFELTGEPNAVLHCHCESCRRATASPFTTWVGQQNGRWRLTGNAPTSYQSSPGTTRGFCGTCGSPLFYRADKYPDELYFYAALLDHPESVRPAAHWHTDEMLAWIHLSDGLPHE